jgi:hypothetical protein
MYPVRWSPPVVKYGIDFFTATRGEKVDFIDLEVKLAALL